MIRTHGQIAYEAFWQTFATAVGADIDPWDSIHRATQQAWEAAARAVLAAQGPREGIILSRAELEHLLNCLANQKFLHEMVEPLRGEAQALIDMAWRKGMGWLASVPKEDAS